MVSRHLAALKQRQTLLLACTLGILLLAKFLWPLFVYDVPLGYDAGIYRYLFLKHAEGFPPFIVTPLEPWAADHPLGLFMFSTILLRLGMPVDWLIGWIWNVCAVVPVMAMAWVMRKKYGDYGAIGIMGAGFLSVAYFDGFAAMYIKTFASLLWMVLAFHAINRSVWWQAIIFGVLTVITHHQTGLLFGLVFATWVIVQLIQAFTGASVSTAQRRNALMAAGGGVLICLIGLIAYMPVWQNAVAQHLPELFGQTEAAAGNFPPLSFYLRTQGILLAVGIYGLALSFRRERWTVWQLAVLWSAAFVLLHLIFYRRFMLQLDFFLLPFAGMAMADLWQRYRTYEQRTLFALLCAAQITLMLLAIVQRQPMIDDATFTAVKQAQSHVPATVYVVGLDTDSAVFLRGWLPHQKVGGPGLFHMPWSYQHWETFLFGTHDERLALLESLQEPVYLFAPPMFRAFYGQNAETFLSDPCFEQIIEHPMWYRVTCTTFAP